MNFFSKTLSTLTGQAIPYNKGEFVARVDNLWDLYDGTVKIDGSNCTIFQFDKQQASSSNYKFALNGAKKLSIIKYPGVLKVFEVIDQDSVLYLVTERVKPLSYSSTSNSKDAKMLGIYNVTKTLRFLNQDANSIHGKINMESVFVTEGGEWKLAGFELLTSLEDQDRQALLQGTAIKSFNMYLNPPELATTLTALAKGKTGIKLDSFKLGCLILQVYNDNVAPVDPGSLQDMLKKVPRNLQAGVKKLLSDSITTRATADLFFRKGEESFFDTDFMRNYNDLQEIDLKTNAEKFEIFSRLIAEVNKYPEGFVEFKLLPALIQFYQVYDQPNAAAATAVPVPQQANSQFQQDDTPPAVDPELGSKVLYNILQLNETCNFNDQKFNKFIKPIIFQSFAKNDRAIRMVLLSSLPQYVNRLEKYEVNNTIFTNLVTGFVDTSAAIREETLKSITVVAEFLTERQLNNDLLRYLAKLQNDQSETIRTNVVICLSKIAKTMNKNSRQNILITAFNKSVKDPFIPTRLSTLVALGTCIEFFNAEVVASRVLSIVAPSLLDKSGKIRQEASKLLELCLDIIKKEAAQLPDNIDDDEDAKDVQNLAQKFADTAFGWGHLNRFATPPIRDAESEEIKAEHHPIIQSANGHVTVAPVVDGDDDQDVLDDFGDNWGDEDDAEEDDDDFFEEQQTKTPIAQPKPQSRVVNGASSGFGKTKTTGTTTTKPTPTTRKPSGLKLSAKPKTSKLKLDLKLDNDDNGWGDGWD